MGSLFARIKGFVIAVHTYVNRRLEILLDEKASFLDKFIHVSYLVWKSFVRNKCPVRATALSYTTLLALVPLLAIGVSITSTMLKEQGAQVSEEMIEKFIQTVAPQLKLLPARAASGSTEGAQGTNALAQTGPEGEPASEALLREEGAPAGAHEQLSAQINRFINNFHTKSVGLSGLLGFVLVAILLLGTIESTFNDIWGVTRGRSWFRRLVQYWTAISLGPLLIVSAILLKQGAQFRAIQAFLDDWPFLGSLLFHFFPFLVISLGFALVYKLMPNTQVDWQAALTGGAVGGCLWLLVNLFNAASVTRVISMGKLYGSLAIIPVFLIGLYFSWLIVLFGAQVAYALQNWKVYSQERRAEAVSQRGREFVALRVMTRIAHRFETKAPPPTILELADQLSVSSQLVAQVLHSLIEAKLVVEVAEEDACFSPARPLEAISCHDVLQALRVGAGSEREMHTGPEPGDSCIRRHFEEIGKAEREAAAVVTMKQLIEQLPPEKPTPKRSGGRVGERVRRWERQLS